MSELVKALNIEEQGLDSYGSGLHPNELSRLENDLQEALDAWFVEGVNPERTWDKLLLHVCCAPCAEFPLEVLKRYGGLEVALFANPNIHPQLEYDRRKSYAEALMAANDLPMIEVGNSEEERWRSFPQKSKCAHCRACYPIRMDLAARTAKEHGADAYTTTLAVSPYQDHELLLAAGEQAAKRHGVTFIPFDFRPGFRIGQRMARAHQIYRQKYCGCIYSLGESDYSEKIARDLNLTHSELPDRTP